jgi:hypothetical protein
MIVFCITDYTSSVGECHECESGVTVIMYLITDCIECVRVLIEKIEKREGRRGEERREVISRHGQIEWRGSLVTRKRN